MSEASEVLRIDRSCMYQWTQWALISIGVVISLFLLVIPLIVIFMTAFSEGPNELFSNLQDKNMLHAIGLTLFISLIVVPINLVFGTLLAWLVTRFVFPGRQLLLTLFDIPFAVSPVVAGLMYLLFWGINGQLGGWLNFHNIQLMFSWEGMVLVTIFITCPFVVRELVPIMLSQGRHEDEAAVLLGACGWKMFFHVTLPNIRWALLYGIVLTNARAIGEFGAVSIVSGAIRGETYTLPLQVEVLHQDCNDVGAFTAAALLTIMAIFMLLMKSALQWRLNIQTKRRARKEECYEY
ncbi:sulfate/thiosulfate ABC transporter permease CysW [Candidatus Erwinia haradaeae]|uniref:Sulfate transport system permease protein CysW n=1 Tax=Candidatus Erwinia haradaeae TaxID=1922217 RepID=A0A451D2C2_9GAMM|nr:sulfate/thiosulfate ABC transporter permease CysW [Candidatus Erwinia haradaeae]VFP79798.1 Sulfate/thiosulfate ABC transporter permease protein CysW [Candidatus Erwinia haradaeae]